MHEKVNATKTRQAGHKGIVTNVDEFHDRFYLIHGIYGHALKTLTMATSLFRLNIPKESIGSYYSKLIVELLLV
jgi:hypothetical protein